jgi:hypothetical protein
MFNVDVLTAQAAAEDFPSLTSEPADGDVGKVLRSPLREMQALQIRDEGYLAGR